MEYYSIIKKNEIMPFAATWIDLEIIILSEVSLKEKNKYRMLTHIFGIKKKKKFTKNLGTGQNKDVDVENGLEDTGRGKRNLGRSERVSWTYIHYQM